MFFCCCYGRLIANLKKRNKITISIYNLLFDHQTLHFFCGFIGESSAHRNSRENSLEFDKVPANIEKK